MRRPSGRAGRAARGVDGLERSYGYARLPSPTGSDSAWRDDAPIHGEKAGLGSNGLAVMPENAARFAADYRALHSGNDWRAYMASSKALGRPPIGPNHFL